MKVELGHQSPLLRQPVSHLLIITAIDLRILMLLSFLTPEATRRCMDEAKSEFNDFIPLLQSGCHEKLGTLLCFIYFPFCDSARPSIRIYPCNELCEEVHNSPCTNLINSHGSGWNTALQCNNSIYRPISSNLCANGAAPDYN